MNLTKEIESAEKKYRQILEDFFIEKWGETRLFSHDISHHRRVWQYAKTLLFEVNSKDPGRINFSPYRLLIACYLHDLGMTVDTGERHGSHSSKLCREFIAVNKLSEGEFSEVIAAVEDHDNKGMILKTNIYNIRTFLTAADDLDAFGHIGIYRYLEIYMARGMYPEIIGHEIRKNALCRFRNFELAFGAYPELVEQHKKRFLIIYNFFNKYNREIAGEL
jgi:HD superfamily phosphodiesterase